MLPVPTRDAAEMVKALKAESPPYSSSKSRPSLSLPFGVSVTALSMSGNMRI